MRGTASDVAGTISATIICNTLIDSKTVIATTEHATPCADMYAAIRLHVHHCNRPPHCA